MVLEHRRGCALFSGSLSPCVWEITRAEGPGTQNNATHLLWSWGAAAASDSRRDQRRSSFCRSTGPQTSPHLPRGILKLLCILLFFLFLKNKTVTYSAVPGLSCGMGDLFGCGMWELQSQHRGPSSLRPGWNPA